MGHTQKKKKKILGKSLMFPLHGHVNSIAIQNFFNFEIKKMPGHNWEITKKGRATNLESRSDKTSRMSLFCVFAGSYNLPKQI